MNEETTFPYTQIQVFFGVFFSGTLQVRNALFAAVGPLLMASSI